MVVLRRMGWLGPDAGAHARYSDAHALTTLSAQSLAHKFFPRCNDWNAVAARSIRLVITIWGYGQAASNGTWACLKGCYYDGAAIQGSLSLRNAREANAHDYLLKTRMPNGGRLQMRPAVGLSRQTQHANSTYGIHRHGIIE